MLFRCLPGKGRLLIGKEKKVFEPMIMVALSVTIRNRFKSSELDQGIRFFFPIPL
jgi:hypothetical protein